MNKFNLNTNYDNSIDFDFFETDVDRTNQSSKIITQAVIETNPESYKQNSKSDVELVTENSKDTFYIKSEVSNHHLSINYSSEEKVANIDESNDNNRFNCLAFNDHDTKQTCINEEKDFSDNSLSDSTITTVTSDLTTVSRLSMMSDSSCGSDLSDDAPLQQVESLENTTWEGNLKDNLDHLNAESSKKTLTMVDNENSDKNSHETKNLTEFSNESHSELTDHEYEYDENSFEKSTIENDDNVKPSVIENNTENDVESIKSHTKEIGRGNLKNQRKLSRKESTSTIEEKLEGISLASASSSHSNIVSGNCWRGQNRFRSKRRELNLSFSREELIKIERDNTILLKKIMSYSKPKSVVLNHSLSHKKTSAAINRARQQKKIEQDNYILYSKINAMNRIKKVY